MATAGYQALPSGSDGTYGRLVSDIKSQLAIVDRAASTLEHSVPGGGGHAACVLLLPWSQIPRPHLALPWSQERGFEGGIRSCNKGTKAADVSVQGSHQRGARFGACAWNWPLLRSDDTQTLGS